MSSDCCSITGTASGRPPAHEVIESGECPDQGSGAVPIRPASCVVASTLRGPAASSNASPHSIRAASGLGRVAAWCYPAPPEPRSGSMPRYIQPGAHELGQNFLRDGGSSVHTCASPKATSCATPLPPEPGHSSAMCPSTSQLRCCDACYHSHDGSGLCSSRSGKWRGSVLASEGRLNSRRSGGPGSPSLSFNALPLVPSLRGRPLTREFF